MGYFIKKDKYTGEIIYMEYDIEGYKFKPRNDLKKPYINVKSVVIYKPEMIDKLLSRKFEKQFAKLSNIIMKYLYTDDDDSDEGDFMIMLDEIARLKALVENKYKRYLSVEEYNNYIHKLAFLDNQVRQKVAILNYRAELNYEVSKGRGM